MKNHMSNGILQKEERMDLQNLIRLVSIASFPSVTSQLDIYPESGVTLVVLSNHSFEASPVIEKISQILKL